MDDLILQSKGIIDRAIADFKPKAIIMMFSGGDDSLTAYNVCKQLGVALDAVMFGDTRTGIDQTRGFVIKETTRLKDNLVIADAGSSYVDYVMRKGFFGKGDNAHNFSYHKLKSQHFSREVSKCFRHRRRGYPILFINGARRTESARRMKTMLSPINFSKWAKNDIWVNIINEWGKPDCIDYLEGTGISRNPVSINLCCSGECMCGTMQSKGQRAEAAFFYPAWGQWLNELETKAKEIHGFGWGVQRPKVKDKNQLDMFQPMCVSCRDKAAGIIPACDVFLKL